MIEGDAKLYFDALNGDVQNYHWNAKTLLSNTMELKTYFANFFFFIESRESIINAIAHALAKIVSLIFPVFNCNYYSLPSYVWEAWERVMLIVYSIPVVS